MAQKPVQRVTMFKVDDPANLQHFISCYQTMNAASKKDGKPYILSLKVGPTNASDPRNNGFTFAAMSQFASIDDMKFYDNDDEAHQELKNAIKGKHSGVMTVYFEDALQS